MTLDGYTQVDVTPWEDATDGKAVACDRTSGSCTATTKFEGKAGTYTVDVRYFDLNDGVATFELSVNGKDRSVGSQRHTADEANQWLVLDASAHHRHCANARRHDSNHRHSKWRR